jgi:uncharacterized protein (TIGR02246 family)
MTAASQPAPDRNAADRAAIARATAALLTAVNASHVDGVLDVWCQDGVLMPPGHPSVHGREALERYFSRLFSERRFTFTFTASQIRVGGDIAVERVEYIASACPREGGPPVEDRGKGVHVFRRQPDGSWKLFQDIWNSDARHDSEPTAASGA